MIPKSKLRLDVFDGLKGLSIIVIICYYFFEYLLPGGYLAVNAFLLVAGFFNFRHFYTADMRGQSIQALTYYKRRLNRLFFPLLFVIFSTGMFVLLFARDQLFNMRNMALSSLLFVNNYYQILNNQSYFVQAANPSAFTHLWYVSLLAQLILITPIMVKLFYSWHRKPAITVNILMIVSVISAVLLGYWYQENMDPTRVYYDLLTRAFAYTLGGAIGLLFPVNLNARPIRGRVRNTLNIVGLVMIIAMFFMVKFMYGTQPFAYRFGMTLFTIIFAIFLMISIHPSTLWHKILKFPLFVFLGKRSYSYYLWFYPIYLVLPYLSGSLLNYRWTIIIQFLVLIILAEITYQMFEIQRWSLPIGQDFNRRKMVYQFNYLRNHPQKLTHIKVLSGIYVFVAVIGAMAILIAPEKKQAQENDIQNIIEENQSIIEQTQSQETDTVKVVNHVEGLNQQEALYANALDITFVGDSILLSTAQEIQFVFPKAIIDGEVGRQLYNSVPVIQYLEQNGLLNSTVVNILGTNSTFTPGQINDYIDAIGPERDIFFVTTTANRSWISDTNAQIHSAAARYGNVHVIDWASYVQNHPEWIHDEFGHPTPEGGHQLAILIAQEIFRQR